jgi:hypothetical protein
MIKKTNGGYLLMDKAGKRMLGRHKTKKQALSQEKAIIMKKRGGGK